jgi:hypothetical protein
MLVFVAYRKIVEVPFWGFIFSLWALQAGCGVGAMSLTSNNVGGHLKQTAGHDEFLKGLFEGVPLRQKHVISKSIRLWCLRAINHQVLCLRTQTSTYTLLRAQAHIHYCVHKHIYIIAWGWSRLVGWMGVLTVKWMAASGPCRSREAGWYMIYKYDLYIYI